MNEKELIEKLQEIVDSQGKEEDSDTEERHGKADDLLIEFINNEEIKKVYDSIYKWYS